MRTLLDGLPGRPLRVTGDRLDGTWLYIPIDAGRPYRWTLIPQLTEKHDGESIRPDGTFKDIFNQVRGHWKAKDPRDDLPMRS